MISSSGRRRPSRFGVTVTAYNLTDFIAATRKIVRHHGSVMGNRIAMVREPLTEMNKGHACGPYTIGFRYTYGAKQ